MRIKLALAAGAAVLLTAGTGAVAYAVVGQETVSPTITGNDLPIDDNHSPTVTARTTEPGDGRGTTVEPGDDRGTTVEPGDDRGSTVEPGDDRGGFEPGDDRSTGVDDGARHGGSARTAPAPATSDDHGGSGGSGSDDRDGHDGDNGGGHGGHGGDDGGGHH